MRRRYAERLYYQEEEPGLTEFNLKMRKKWEKDRANLEQFLPPKEAQEKREELEELEIEYDKKTAEASAAEYMVLEGIYEGYWLGGNPEEKPEDAPEVYAVPTSEYDDIKNGVDVVVAIKRKREEWMYLGIDVTTSQIDKEIEAKLNRTYRQTKRGQLAKVEYYYSPNSEEEPRGKIELPRVVVGLEKSALAGLAKDFLNNKTKIPKHEIQLELIQEIIDQLTVIIEIAVNDSLRKVKGFTEHEFKTPEAALKFINDQGWRQKLHQANSRILSVLDSHGRILDYMIEVQKEKSSLGEISPQRARDSQVFRLLAPKKSQELLKAA